MYEFGRGVRAGAQREVLRLFAQGPRALWVLIIPLFFLFTAGAFDRSTPSPRVVGSFAGILAFLALSLAIIGGQAVIGDARTGGLRAMLVAPVSRPGLLFGRTLGSAVTSLVQCAAYLAIAIFIGVRLDVVTVVSVLAVVLFVGVALSGMGILAAADPFRPERSGAFRNLVVYALIGAGVIMSPDTQGPAAALVYLNPMAYAADAIRHLIVSSALPDRLDFFTLSIGGHRMAVWQDLLAVAAFAVPVTIVATRRLSRLFRGR